ADCVDPDDDNDGVADASDCAPLDATAFGVAAEVDGPDVQIGAPTPMTYVTQPIGTGTNYTIVGGLISRLIPAQGFQQGFCLSASPSGGPCFDNRPLPRPGDSWYYLIRANNACGIGTFGSPLADQAGSGNVCQLGQVDADADGSPSNLDCNDSDPTRAPFFTEVCDGVDNNCNNVVDDGNPGGGAISGSRVGTCHTGTTQCVSGGLSCVGSVGPGPEFCDGLDNDCDGIPDDHVVDTDNDGLNDCVDTDDDNDGILDGSDCAPRDAT